MPAKQKPNETIIKALKDKYFLLAAKENIGQTDDCANPLYLYLLEHLGFENFQRSV